MEDRKREQIYKFDNMPPHNMPPHITLGFLVQEIERLGIQNTTGSVPSAPIRSKRWNTEPTTSPTVTGCDSRNPGFHYLNDDELGYQDFDELDELTLTDRLSLLQIDSLPALTSMITGIEAGSTNTLGQTANRRSRHTIDTSALRVLNVNDPMTQHEKAFSGKL
ncbi:hypothetical protein G7Z17_g5054 [Cylindrodendrum hubeiense]|uniref:Uncharacterized protein n=1 Tax=Cylindrodendrum hubeiense TaxID=595255 RepID=A0A9P5L9E2_9HYPO|nr:hypothetical protein G7Z17_g5054 [Cylindrodendrum hubeiense]